MPVRQRALDREGVLAGRDHDPSLQHAAQPLDALGGPVAQIEQRALANATPVPIALAQQNGGRRAAIADGFDIQGALRALRFQEGDRLQVLLALRRATLVPRLILLADEAVGSALV